MINKMLKIYFTNNWGENDESFLNRMKTTTPNNSGIWGNITYTKDIQKADYIVSLGGKPNLNIDKQKLLVFQREPNILSMMTSNNKDNYFNYNRLYHLWTHPEHMQMNYNNCNELHYNKKQKNVQQLLQ